MHHVIEVIIIKQNLLIYERLIYVENSISFGILCNPPLPAAIPPNIGAHYRSTEMQFWNEDLPNLLRHPNKDISGPTRPRGPRPQSLDFADGIGKYANNTANRKYESYDSKFVMKLINFTFRRSKFFIIEHTSLFWQFFHLDVFFQGDL